MDGQISGSLESFGQAVHGLGESSRAQVSTLSALSSQAELRETRLVDLVGQQNRRFTMLFVVTIALAAIAIATAAVGIVLRWAG